ncbi:hypothetical protein TL16_g05964 [Triparma laevis f. inornata]|nr:hypothetical protein TL16_g05964 [Triparma laevis f. inornata]
MKLAMERNDVVRVAELEKDKSDKLFAMERMREAKKKGQLRLYKVWSDRLKLLQSLDGDGYLESKDEWYEETRLKNVKRLENSNSSEGLDELLKGTSLDPNNDE